MKKIRLGTIIAMLTILLTGCGMIQSKIDKTVRDQSNKNLSLAYAILDMTDAPIDAKWVTLKRVDSKKNDDRWVMRVHDHVAYIENLPAGHYMIADFGGSSTEHYGRFSVTTNYTYDMPENSKENETTFKINKPGTYYFGSYRYKEVSKTRGKSVFDLVKKKGGKKTAAKAVLPYTEGTKWHKKLKKSAS